MSMPYFWIYLAIIKSLESETLFLPTIKEQKYYPHVYSVLEEGIVSFLLYLLYCKQKHKFNSKFPNHKIKISIYVFFIM